jgi:hypothetical protein
LQLASHQLGDLAERQSRPALHHRLRSPVGAAFCRRRGRGVLRRFRARPVVSG